MTRWLGMALVGAVGIGSLLAGCGGGGNTDGGDMDASDMGASTPCADGFVPPDPDAAVTTCYRATTCDGGAFCPAVVQNNPMRPIFRITQLAPRRPATLATPALTAVLNPAIAQGRFGWGIVLDLTAMTIRTGALQPGVMPQMGTGLLGATFQFYNGNALMLDGGAGSPTRWDPIMGSITVMGDNVSTPMPVGQITVPAFDEMTGALLTELPIRNARLTSVRMTSDHNCIGLGRATFNSCQASAWVMLDPTMMPYGTIEGDLSVDDAMNVTVQNLGQLYQILVGGAPCVANPMGMGCTPPDTAIGGSTTPNAWHLVSDFTAVSANISGQ